MPQASWFVAAIPAVPSGGRNRATSKRSFFKSHCGAHRSAYQAYFNNKSTSLDSVCLLGHLPALDTFVVEVFGYECDEIKRVIKAGQFLEIELCIQIHWTIALIFWDYKIIISFSLHVPPSQAAHTSPSLSFNPWTLSLVAVFTHMYIHAWGKSSPVPET